MILLDLNQVVIANLMFHLKKKKDKVVNKDLVRHMIFDSIRAYNLRFSNTYGELIVCCDDRHYWRKKYFPHYKAHRQKDQEKSQYDWSMIFDTIENIKHDIIWHFHFKLIQVDAAEADDIIAAICHYEGRITANGRNVPQILIISGDKDLAQLQKYKNVDQYSPNTKQFIKITNTARYLHEHIIRGDRGDGIPNFISPDDCFVTENRQKRLLSTKVQKWLNQRPEEFCTEQMLRGYKRNQILIDLDFVPSDIEDEAIRQYRAPTKDKSRSTILKYFMKHNLSDLSERIQDF